MLNLIKINATLVFKCCVLIEKRGKNATKVVEMLRFRGKYGLRGLFAPKRLHSLMEFYGWFFYVFCFCLGLFIFNIENNKIEYLIFD